VTFHASDVTAKELSRLHATDAEAPDYFPKQQRYKNAEQASRPNSCPFGTLTNETVNLNRHHLWFVIEYNIRARQPSL
jgi:hypothetical protein